MRGGNVHSWKVPKASDNTFIDHYVFVSVYTFLCSTQEWKYISCWTGIAHVQCSGVMVSKTMRPWLHEPDFRGRVCEAQSQTSLTCFQTPSQGLHPGLHPYEMGPGLENVGASNLRTGTW